MEPFYFDLAIGVASGLLIVIVGLIFVRVSSKGGSGASNDAQMRTATSMQLIQMKLDELFGAVNQLQARVDAVQASISNLPASSAAEPTHDAHLQQSMAAAPLPQQEHLPVFDPSPSAAGTPPPFSPPQESSTEIIPEAEPIEKSYGETLSPDISEPAPPTYSAIEQQDLSPPESEVSESGQQSTSESLPRQDGPAEEFTLDELKSEPLQPDFQQDAVEATLESEADDELDEAMQPYHLQDDDSDPEEVADDEQGHHFIFEPDETGSGEEERPEARMPEHDDSEEIFEAQTAQPAQPQQPAPPPPAAAQQSQTEKKDDSSDKKQTGSGSQPEMITGQDVEDKLKSIFGEL